MIKSINSYGIISLNIILIFLSFNELKGQVYNAGILEFNKPQVFFSETNTFKDSAELLLLKSEIELKSLNKIYFTPNKLATFIHFPNGYMRVVMDTSGYAKFVLDSIKEYVKYSLNEMRQAIEDSIKEISFTRLKYKLYGFETDSLVYVVNEKDTVRCLCTSQLKFLSYPFITHLLNINGGSRQCFALKSVIKMEDYIIHLASVSKYTPLLSDLDSIFIVPDDYKLMTTSGTDNSNNDYASEEATPEEYEYGQGANLEKLKYLIQHEHIDTSELEGYEVKDILKYNKNYDDYSIIKLLESKLGKVENFNAKEAIKVLISAKLIDEKIKKDISTIIKKEEHLSKDNFWKYIYLLKLKAEFQKSDVKTIIVNNHIEKGIDTGSDISARENYLSGKIDFSEYICSVTNLLKPLNHGYVKTGHETEQLVKRFFDLALDEIVQYTLMVTDTSFIINTTQYKYEILFNEIEEPNWDLNYDEDAPIVYSDTIHLTSEFYQKLLKTVKQIDADYKSPYAFSIYKFDEMITEGGEEIVTENIKLKPFKYRFCLNRFLVDEYEPFNEISISFREDQRPFKSFLIDQYKVGDIDGNKPYVTTEEKKMFIELMKKYKNDYGILDEEIHNVEKRIKNDLIDNGIYLLDMFPALGFSNFELAELFNNKDQYYRGLPDSLLNLQFLFPNIMGFVEEKFKPNEYRLMDDGTNLKIEFKYNNKVYQSSLLTASLVETIGSIVNNDNSYEKKIYRFRKDIGEDYFLFCKPSFIEAYQKLFDFYFTKIGVKD